MTTIRKSASLKKLIAVLTFATGVAGTFVLMQLFGHEESEMQFIHFIPFLVGTMAMPIAHFIMKCQACGGNLAPTIMTSGSPIAVSKKIHFCPYCGINIDTEITHCKDKLTSK